MLRMGRHNVIPAGIMDVRVRAPASAYVSPYVLQDTFTGTGALTSHTPDVYPAGSSWAIKSGTFANLAGGVLPYTTGHHAAAIINAGIAAYDVECLCYTTATYGSTGIVICSSSDATNHYTIGISVGAIYTLEMRKYTSLTATSQLTYYNGATLSDAYHTIRAVLQSSGELRIGVDGTLYRSVTLSDYITNTYVGVGHYYADADNKWDSFTVKALPAFANFTFLGDSITDPAAQTYPQWSEMVTWNAGTGYTNLQNHAVTGQSIMAHMDAQVDAAASDTPSKIFVALGTNDSDDAGITAEYLENIQELWSDHPGVPIYCMNILPRTKATDNSAVNNPRIAAAVASAAAAGVNVTLLDTRSPSDWINPATDTADGLHPNAAGAMKIMTEVLARL